MADQGKIDEGKILTLFNLEEEDIEKFDVCLKDNQMVIDVTLKEKENVICPHCHQERIHVKEYIVKKINHALLSDRKTVVDYHARRYKCLACKRTFYEFNPFVFKKQKISALTVRNILEDLKNPSETFINVALRYHLSPTSVASIFDEHVAMERLVFPEYLCIDEAYAFKKDDSKYVCMFVDFFTGEPIDILSSRKKEALIEYFSRIPLSERKRVKIVAMDMWDTYRQVVKQMFPNSLAAADHYHLIQELNRKTDRIRIRVMKRYGGNSVEYYLLKHFNWVIYKDKYASDKDGTLLFDKDRKGKFNHRLNKEVNYYDILELIKKIDDDLREAIELKDRCSSFYLQTSYEEAPSKLKKLIYEFRDSNIEEMKEFASTMYKWRQEIINSFIIVDYKYTVDHKDGHVVSERIRMNSAIMERQNATLKIIKKVTMGMHNWDRFRNRSLYALRKNATYRLEPIDNPKARRQYKVNHKG